MPTDEGDALESARGIEAVAEQITADNAATYLSRANRVLAAPRAMPRAKLFARAVRGHALSTMGRQDDACAELKQVRTAYAIMDSAFRAHVDLLLDPQSGACQ